MNRVDHLANRLLEDTMRRRIGDHTAREGVLVLLALGFPVSEIGVTQFIALHYARLETRLHARRRVGAMRRGRDKKHLAVCLFLTMQELTDDYQSRIFTGRTGGRLQRAGFEARDGAELLFELLHDGGIAFYLLGGCQRVNSQRSVVGDGDHRRRRVELHRARTQRDHRGRQGDIFAVEALEVTHQFGLGMVVFEHRCLQEVDIANAALVNRP